MAHTDDDDSSPDTLIDPEYGDDTRVIQDRRNPEPQSGAGPRRRWSDDPVRRAAHLRALLAWGNIVFKLRTKSGWSIDRLSQESGVNHQTIVDIEKARADPRISTTIRLLVALGYEPAYGIMPVRQFNSSRVTTPADESAQVG